MMNKSMKAVHGLCRKYQEGVTMRHIKKDVGLMKIAQVHSAYQGTYLISSKRWNDQHF